MYLDTPEENIYDEFQEQVFGTHPLGHNILGTVESLALVAAATQALRRQEKVAAVAVGPVMYECITPTQAYLVFHLSSPSAQKVRVRTVQPAMVEPVL